MLSYVAIVNRTWSSASFGLLGAVAVGVLGQGCGGDDQRPAEWAYIQPVLLAPSCATASCHSKAAAVVGLDLSAPEVAYRSLTRLETKVIRDPGTPDGTQLYTRPLVSPCRPAESRLVNMLRARGAQRMPPDRPMAEADIALIERWILAGAKEKPGDADPCAVDANPGAINDPGTAGMGGS